MTREEITTSVIDAIKEQLNIQEVSEDAILKDDLGADSLDLVELIMKAEDQFGIEISDEEADSITTVESFINFICTKIEVM